MPRRRARPESARTRAHLEHDHAAARLGEQQQQQRAPSFGEGGGVSVAAASSSRRPRTDRVVLMCVPCPRRSAAVLSP